MRPLSPKLSWTLSGQRYQRPTDARDLPLLTPFERPSCSAAHQSAAAGKNGVSEYRSADAGEKIGEIGDLLGCHRLQRLRHGGVVAVPAVVLVFPQGLGEIILALAGNARDIFAAGEIRLVAGAAGILLRPRPGPQPPRPA